MSDSDLATPTLAEPAPGTILLIGGYTAEMNGSAAGLVSLRWDQSNRDQVDILAHEPVAVLSPSWVEAHPTSDLVFACTESEPGKLAVFRLATDGSLTLLREVESGGSAGCHLAISPDARIVVTANYGDGSVSSFSAVDDDTLGDRLDHHPFTTSGPNPDRQTHAHAHQVVFDAELCLVADLGGDVIHQLRVDRWGTFEVAAEPIQLPPGSGPRHFVITGEHLVVACELSVELWLARRDATAPSGWRHVATVPASGREPDAEHPTYPSGIAILDDLVVVANREVDTFASFALDRATDQLRLLGEQPTLGAWPRDLSIVAGRLWIATQQGNAIASYLPVRDEGGVLTGRWDKDLEFETPSPARIAIVTPATQETKQA